jgi:hypothetical protein
MLAGANDQTHSIRQPPPTVRPAARQHRSRRPGKHAADASHLSEAAETGCSYFITHDNRILNRRDELYAALPPTLTIVTLEEFFDIYDTYKARPAQMRQGAGL